MKRILAAGALAGILALARLTPAPAAEMELSTGEISDLCGAFSALGDPHKEGDKVVVYKLGIVRGAIRENAVRLKPICQVYSETGNDQIVELSGGKSELPEGSAEKAVYMKADRERRAVKHKVDLIVIKELDYAQNEIPTSTLIALTPILRDNALKY